MVAFGVFPERHAARPVVFDVCVDLRAARSKVFGRFAHVVDVEHDPVSGLPRAVVHAPEPERCAVGEFELTGEALTLPGDHGLTIITYTVEPHSDSEQALNFLASWSAQASPANPRESETSEETM